MPIIFFPHHYPIFKTLLIISHIFLLIPRNLAQECPYPCIPPPLPDVNSNYPPPPPAQPDSSLMYPPPPPLGTNPGDVNNNYPPPPPGNYYFTPPNYYTYPTGPAPPPPDPILPWFPWYYKNPPPPPSSSAVRRNGCIGTVIMVFLGIFLLVN